MWFGIHYIPEDDMAVVHVYQRERYFTIGGAPDALPQILDVLRLCMYDSALALPRCRSCGTGIEAPDIDGLEAACSA